jgi:hypothetical protein
MCCRLRPNTDSRALRIVKCGLVRISWTSLSAWRARHRGESSRRVEIIVTACEARVDMSYDIASWFGSVDYCSPPSAGRRKNLGSYAASQPKYLGLEAAEARWEWENPVIAHKRTTVRRWS